MGKEVGEEQMWTPSSFYITFIFSILPTSFKYCDLTLFNIWKVFDNFIGFMNFISEVTANSVTENCYRK